MARPKKTKTQRIKELLSEGKSVPEIVKATKSHPSMVYAVRAKQKEKAKPVTITPNEVKPCEWVEYPVEQQPTLWQRVCNAVCFWK